MNDHGGEEQEGLPYGIGDPCRRHHIDLKMRCEEEGVPFHVIPGNFTTSLAVSLSGLQSYSLGQVTIPYSTATFQYPPVE